MNATATRSTRPITDPQRDRILRDAAKRAIAADVRDRLVANVATFTIATASATIDWLNRQPVRHGDTTQAAPATRSDVVTVTAPGMYRDAAGVIYLVQASKQNPGRLYAKTRHAITAQRLNEDGDRVKFEYDYTPGAIYGLTPAMQVTVAEATSLSLEYGACCKCGRKLKAATSVERSIGPVCIKSFA